MQETYTAKIWGDTHSLRADFSDAASDILVLVDDDTWLATTLQVADVKHSPVAAMRQYLCDLCRASGDDPYDPEFTQEIDAAVERMTKESAD